MKPRVLSIVGRSDSGKTTLMVKLVRRLSRKGYRVGTIKHYRHAFEIDQPGKDSYRHFHAGSVACVIASEGKLALVRRLDKPPRLEGIVADYFRGLDLVLAEGFKRGRQPKIEVLRSGTGLAPVCRPRGDGLIAVVCDEALPGYFQPRFRPQEVGKIVHFIEREFL